MHVRKVTSSYMNRKSKKQSFPKKKGQQVALEHRSQKSARHKRKVLPKYLKRLTKKQRIKKIKIYKQIKIENMQHLALNKNVNVCIKT